MEATKTEAKKNKNYFWKYLKNIIFYFLVFIFLLIALFSIMGNKGIGEYKSFNILTGSMSPNINPGSLIITKKVDTNEIKANDVITFKGSNTKSVTTHRVVEVIKDKDGKVKFQTKGDANKVLDPMLIGQDLVVGKVICSMPHLGSIINFIIKFKVIIMALAICLLVLSSIFDNKIKVKGDI